MKKLLLILPALLALLTIHSSALDTDTGMAFELKVSEQSVILYAGFSGTVGLSFSPGSAEVGVDCGMPDMCGINPCTCGSADRWGSCSCNGLKSVLPAVDAKAADPRLAAASYQNGSLRIKALRPGTTSVTVTATLSHYGIDQQAVTVTILAIPVWWYVLGGAILAVLIFLVIIISRRISLKVLGGDHS